MPFPRMMKVRQHFEAPEVGDIPGTVKERIEALDLSRKVARGDSVAVTVGSRGINNIAVITRAAVEALKELGAEPFIVPAMGSHGGGTAEGQREIVESYGVTEEFVGCPIRSTMEVVQVGTVEGEVPVYFDKYASEADHVVVAGRVKPHTGFVGEIESGLHKMMLIGLGKHRGAAVYHQAIVQYSFDRIIRAVGQQVIDKGRVLFGLAIVENQYDQTAEIDAVPPEKFVEREKELLVLAQAVDAAPALRPGRPAHRRPDGQEHLRLRHGHQRRGPQVLRPLRRRQGVPQGDAHLRPRPHPGDPRQRRRHRHGRVLPPAPGRRHGRERHRHQLHDRERALRRRYRSCPSTSPPTASAWSRP